MKIYSWNMLFKNAQQERALAFIRESDFDIFCLQEVPQDFLDRLTAAFPHLASTIETSRIFAGEVGTNYLVTISRWPITEHTGLEIAARPREESPRTSYFTRVMFALRLWAKGRGARNNLLTQVRTPQFGLVSIYNLHLPLKYPTWRAEEFEAALAGLDHAVPTIICGDFNILESPHITVLNWLLGGTITDALLYARERKDIEERFRAHGLSNPLRGQSTHPLSQSQLDHILVSDSFSVTNACVSSNRAGSDHAPISVTLT